jgi:hypothetical protein
LRKTKQVSTAESTTDFSVKTDPILCHQAEIGNQEQGQTTVATTQEGRSYAIHYDVGPEAPSIRARADGHPSYHGHRAGDCPASHGHAEVAERDHHY